MSGLYIHIPFCHRRCPYCNFFATASKKDLQGFSKHIIRELRLRKDFLGDEMLRTIYLGGGTPSMMHPAELDRILNEVSLLFDVSEDVEVTLEANPEDISTRRCHEWVAAGINRLSIGTQSFRDEDLAFLQRIHDARRSLHAVRTALGSGFDEVSIDLIYGIPGQSDEDWLMNLNTFFSLRLPHFSAYSLTVEPGTPLQRMVGKGKVPDADDGQAYRHFMLLREQAARNGYEHYEVSNLCLPGHYSRHNTAYWQGRPYLGIGPSAHSFDGKVRSWNPSSIQGYLTAISDKSLPEGQEELTAADRFNEFVMLGLRTQWGIDLKEVQKRFGNEKAEMVRQQAGEPIAQGWMEKEGEVLKLTGEGLFRADGIASGFFIVAIEW